MRLYKDQAVIKLNIISQAQRLCLQIQNAGLQLLQHRRALLHIKRLFNRVNKHADALIVWRIFVDSFKPVDGVQVIAPLPAP